MSRPLTFPTAGRYETRFLLNGTVKVEGFDIEFIDTGAMPWPVFADMVTDLTYDIAEQAISHYVIALAMGKPLTAIPIFPSFFFPQMGIAVNRQAGIETPEDLINKRVGVLSFGYNPAVWTRGILEQVYGVDSREIIWVEDADDPLFTGLDYPRPGSFRVERVPGLMAQMQQGTNILAGELLESGTIDAVALPAWGPPEGVHVRPLFADPLTEIRNFVALAGALPINTVITLREETVKRHPDLPAALNAAMIRAKSLYMQEMIDGSETTHMGVETGFLKELGFLPTPTGLEQNRASLTLILEYLYRQELITQPMIPEDLFCLT